MSYYELGFIAENVSKRLGEIEKFAQDIDDYFENDVLTGFNIGLWSGSDTIGFWLVFEKFEQGYIQVFQKWTGKYRVKVLEVMDKPQEEVDKLRDEFILKSDMSFLASEIPMSVVFESFRNRLKEI